MGFSQWEGQLSTMSPRRPSRQQDGALIAVAGQPALPESARVTERGRRNQWAWPKTGANDVTVLSGPAATETAVKKAAAGHRVVHLATHGFFLGADCAPTPSGVRSVGGLVSLSGPAATAGEDKPAPPDRVGVRGCQQAGAAAALDQDEGILTADEIAKL